MVTVKDPLRKRARRSTSITLALFVAMTAAAAALGVSAATAPPVAGAVPPVVLAAPLPSDPRATFVQGNVTTCDALGFDTAVQVGAEGNQAASDVDVSGTVSTNAGPVQPGQGEELNVTVTGSGVVVDAIVVKGGNGYNLYTAPAVLPPSLASPQHYIAPFNGGGNVPALSHWFVCYHLSAPDPVGSLVVLKRVISPDGIPVDPVPASVSALVTCSDGTIQTVTFTRGGGRPVAIVTGLPIGTTCTVVEQGTGSFPGGTTVSYEPAGADTAPGVTIGATTGTVVEITNDLSGVALRTAAIELTKVTQPADGVPVPASFSARIVCEDGTNADVTLPGGGGPGVPTVAVRIPTLCVVGELPASVPDGWTVAYSVNGVTPPTTPPIFPVLSTTTVAVTVTNTATATTSTTTSTTTTTAPAVTSTTAPAVEAAGAGTDGTAAHPGDLARSGSDHAGALTIGALTVITAGGSLVLAGRRSRRRRVTGG
jgi:hypothetical protein